MCQNVMCLSYANAMMKLIEAVVVDVGNNLAPAGHSGESLHGKVFCKSSAPPSTVSGTTCMSMTFFDFFIFLWYRTLGFVAS